MTDRELIRMAQAAAESAYAPYSQFRVGAALEAENGQVFTGCNVENAALGECICAERTAVCKAVSEGVRSFRRLAVFAEGDSYCLPCGSCRQVLSEFAPDIELLCVRGDGAYVSYPLRALLPHPFKLN